MNDVCMDASTYQVLLGSILGDGCITKNTKKCKNYCFKEMHGPEQREYVAWKGEMLKQLGTIVCGKTRPELFTKTMPYFTKLRELVYGDKAEKNRLPDDLFQNTDALGLLVWFLDDGTWQQGQWCIKSELFELDDLQRLVDHLNHKLQLCLKIYDYSYTRMIAFRKMSKDKMLPVWEEMFKEFNIPSSMKYKMTGE